MENQIKCLQNLQKIIEKGLTNFKKCSKDKLTLEYAQTRYELLEEDWTKFRDLYSRFYEEYNSVVTEELVSNMYDTTEDVYINYKSKLKIVINKFTNKVESMVERADDNSSRKPSTLVNLPKITIPTFTGRYSEWITFKDLFTALVHQNDSLNDCQRLHYLKNHVTGEAEQLIRHTPISDANYAQCWAVLEKRYDNKKYQANCILKRLFSQRRINLESGLALKELLDTTNDCLNALQNLKVTTWDVIIIYIVVSKLDLETRKQWELSINSTDNNELPTLQQFTAFIETRYRALEFIDPLKKASVHHLNSSQGQTSRAMLVTNSSRIRCEYCTEFHKLCFCKRFTGLPVKSRRDFVAKNKICFNCLGGNHTKYSCKKLTTCKTCKRRHHSLLHSEDESTCEDNTGSTQAKQSSSADNNNQQIVSCLSTGTTSKPRQVLLATALIKAESRRGDYQLVRALIDQGSQASFVTEATVQMLNLKKIPIHGVITGLGDNRTTVAKYLVHLTIQSRIDSNFKFQCKAYVLSKITSYLPDQSVNLDYFEWVESKGILLADPQFNVPSKIDLLLGADIYSYIIKDGVIKSPTGNLLVQSTALGWILSGSVCREDQFIERNINVLHAHIDQDMIIRKFWEIEEQVGTKKIFTPEEERCEELYKQTTKRDENGRYIVKLPFRDTEPLCRAGNSRGIAEARFKSLEKRLGKDKRLKEEYTKVIKEYLELGHMRMVERDDDKNQNAVYLPHHAVIRNDKTTTKVRVVFNASEKNSNGVSLNDTLMVGPPLQADLRHTVMKWRQHAIGLVADVIKMYRQVRVAEEDTMYQRILWRDNPEMPLQDYELLTVTFGTSSAPYQAVRTLHQIAFDEGKQYPVAEDIVLNSFFMDDLMTGCCTVEEGSEIYKQITELLGKGGFILQKWNSNDQKMLEKISLMQNNNTKRLTHVLKHKDTKNKIERKAELQDQKGIDIKTDSTVKILGLTWDRREDVFQYSVEFPAQRTYSITKRAVISDIARLFDPLGWLAPSVVLAKIFIQRLWLAGLGWDEELPSELVNEWSTYRSELALLTKVKIPRWLGTKPSEDLELHGFSDASKVAYSAVVYLRRRDQSDQIHVSLLVAKTRVAPIRQVSIPRLELCGALLLAKLLLETSTVLNIPKDKIRAWTDSTVVLAWLNSHPSRWKTFVANRTSEILSILSASQWFHVSTANNPADCASRGLMPSLMIENYVWFSGPKFLFNVISYSRPKSSNTHIEESIKAYVASDIKTCDSIIDRFSSLTRLFRVVAYCRRFIKKERDCKRIYLQAREIEEAKETCIKIVQRNAFEKEYLQLKDKSYLPIKTSNLKSLCPYLDSKDIIRVRGRLEKSSLDEQTKSPIVLPKNCQLTNLVIADAHAKTLHGGLQVMLNYLRSGYWIIGVRNVVKLYLRRCVTCAKQRASTKNQFMGSLPSVRCTPARPFLHSGVDYAGPINIRTTRGRGHKSYKGYICVFVCMCTRAIHLEIVSDMSTSAFLAAFRRFVSRRGHCAKLWSDNATTFVGADRELQQLASVHHAIAESLEAIGTEWHFIPPHAPNFGGLWEAGVKSTKFHLKRVIRDSTLTYEELSTLLLQIEACLNSRPISIINTDNPGEPMPLTPGHFLIGEPIIGVPDQNYENTNIGCLSRWQLLQRMLQCFWKRWSMEYLSNLMHRYKWSTQVPEPEVGDVVLIKEEDQPPTRWLLGRVVQKHPGNDNITRVVTLKTKSALLKRPTSKLCILPIASD